MPKLARQARARLAQSLVLKVLPPHFAFKRFRWSSVMNGLRIRFVLLLSLSVMPKCAPADWPAYLNGNQRTGFAESQLELPLKHAWTYRSPAKPVQAWEGPREAAIEGHEMKHRVNFDDAMQVVMSNGNAYFGSTVDHKLHCVNAKTGAPVWSFYTDGPILSLIHI